MKILVVSDSHGNDSVLKDLLKEYPKMDYYLHAGDSQSTSYALFPFDSVRGNCDYFDFDNVRRINTPMGYLVMKHYPVLNSNEEKTTKIFIHGHTHRYAVYKENGHITICPGSITHPRDGSLGTYAILEIETDHINIFIVELGTKNVLLKVNL